MSIPFGEGLGGYPTELKPYLHRAQSWCLMAGITENIHEIPFETREEFESVWPAVLRGFNPPWTSPAVGQEALKSTGEPSGPPRNEERTTPRMLPHRIWTLTLYSVDRPGSASPEGGLQSNASPRIRYLAPSGVRTKRPDGTWLVALPPWPASAFESTGELPEYVTVSADGRTWIPFEQRDPDQPARKFRGRVDLELVVDGKIVDLNRIKLPPHTPVIDRRRLPSGPNQPGTHPSASEGPNSATLWDIGEAARFDRTRKAFVIHEGRVVVDISDGQSLCPLGFRGRSSIGEAVREIVFRYQVANPGRYWLHIVWHPGRSGKEQFEVLFNGAAVGKSRLVDGSETPGRKTAERFPLPHEKGAHEIRLRWLSGDGLRFSEILLTSGQEPPARIKAAEKIAPFPTIVTLDDYENQIGEPGVIIVGRHVRFYAPRRLEKQARIVHEYLVRAYDELHRIVGNHTKDTIVVYSLPKDSPYRLGRTTRCKIWYTYQNIQFETQPEWQKHRVPHVSGYIEEMAHNFVGASLATFGNEAIGWSISRIVSRRVADNPIYEKSLDDARRIQAETFTEYKRLENTFPPGIAPHLCDRIHAHLLRLCEQEYGPRFWPDFFEEIHKARKELEEANRSGTADERRNARCRITVECFDRLMNGRFKKMLDEHGVSLTTDVVSLHFNRPDWNRKLVERSAGGDVKRGQHEEGP